MSTHAHISDKTNWKSLSERNHKEGIFHMWRTQKLFYEEKLKKICYGHFSMVKNWKIK